MFDLKKKLLDLAEDIQYADMYDLTTAPKLIKEAAERIGNLELELIELQSKQHIFGDFATTTSDKIVLHTPQVVDRARIKSELEDLGVEYSVKDNTPRLLRKLQKALRG